VKHNSYAQLVINDAKEYGLESEVIQTAFEIWKKHSHLGLTAIFDEAAMEWDI
jgi:hypothetical protein